METGISVVKRAVYETMEGVEQLAISCPIHGVREIVRVPRGETKVLTSCGLLLLLEWRASTVEVEVVKGYEGGRFLEAFAEARCRGGVLLVEVEVLEDPDELSNLVRRQFGRDMKKVLGEAVEAEVDRLSVRLVQDEDPGYMGVARVNKGSSAARPHGAELGSRRDPCGPREPGGSPDGR